MTADPKEAEAAGWYAMAALVRSLQADERLRPGYYAEPAWSVRDLAGHLGTWLAEAAAQLERILAGTYTGHDVDIDGLNAVFLAAMADQDWDVTWSQANAGRTMLLRAWARLPDLDEEAAWWIRKSALEHYAEHHDRLVAWVAELVAGRGAEPDA